MTDPCRQLQVSISLRVAGALDAAEGARLDAHLAVCRACRAEVERTTELIDLVRLPPPTPAERQVLAELPARVVAELRAPPPTRAPASVRRGRRLAVGALVAAGLVAIVVVPGLVTRQGPPPPAAPMAAHEPVAAEAAIGAAAPDAGGWQEPDLDALWQDASLVAFDGAEDG